MNATPQDKPDRGGGRPNNRNAMKGGEKSTRPPLGKAAKGDEYIKRQVDAWRRAREAELVARYGVISGHQEGLILTAAEWEFCRRRRKRLARLAPDDEKRAEQAELAAANSARRDRAIAEAGLATHGNGRPMNGHEAHHIPELPPSAFEDEEDAEESADTQQNAASEPESVSIQEQDE
jgi:hypothetical protein